MLSEEPVEFDVGGATRRAEATIEQSLAPPCAVQISWSSEDAETALKLISEETSQRSLALPRRSIAIDVLVVEAGESIRCITSSGLVDATAPCDRVSYVIAHIFNFPDFHGPEGYTITREGKTGARHTRCGAVTLRADDWSATISSLEDTRDVLKAIDASDSLRLTHMLRLERTDKQPFPSGDGKLILDALHAFLSLAVGQWSGVGAVSGHNDDDAVVWELWGMYRASPGSAPAGLAWFDRHHGECLKQVWPGFLKLWLDPLWKGTMPKAISWYLAANSQGGNLGLEAKLVLAQVALEHLAWVYCVRQKRMVSEAAFGPRGLSTADKLRLLATTMGIPVDVPRSLPALKGRPGRPWTDIAEVVTELRNGVVHPSKKSEYDHDEFVAASKISMWLLDVVFLRLANHKGNYSNRLMTRWAGEVEAVPWSSEQDGLA